MPVKHTYKNPEGTEEERLERGKALCQPIVDKIYADSKQREKSVFRLIEDESGNLCFRNGLGDRQPIREFQRKAIAKWKCENEDEWKSQFPNNPIFQVLEPDSYL